tara:strand:+ start:838 stop:1398 length:561 start_codon:yes stop_codon:yes gene_type:complete
MKRNIIIARNAIDPALCNEIIQRAQKDFSTASTFQGVVPTVRRSEVSWFNGSIRYLNIYIPILTLIEKVNAQFYNFDLWDPESFQITKYDEKNQGFYEPHVDQSFDQTTPDQHVRKLSLSIQLTPPDYYEGGTFEFPDDKEKFVVEDSVGQGTVVFFPSYVKHGVQPVTKGTRYSLVCWVNGPNFR